MAQWWESAPLVQNAPQARQGADWWSAAPLVQDTAPTRAQDPSHPARAVQQPQTTPDLGWDDGIPYNPDLSAGAITGDNWQDMAMAPVMSAGDILDLGPMSEQQRHDALMGVRSGQRVRLPSGEEVTARGPALEGTGQRQVGGNLYVQEPSLGETAGAWASAATEQLPFFDENVAGIVGALSGDGYDATRERQRGLAAYDREANPTARTVGGISGFAAGLAAPGAAWAGRGNLLARSLRGAGLGTGYGALYGAGAEDGGLAERAEGARNGAILGGIAGGAAPAVTQVGAGLFGLAGRRVGGGINWMTGRRITPLDNAVGPDASARRLLGQAAQRDGVTPEIARQTAIEFLDTDVMPTMIDVLQRAAPGGEAARLIRGAAMQQGPASVMAEQHALSMAGNLQDRAIDMTRRLTPDQRTAQEVVESLTQRRSRLAEAEYAPAYATRVTPPDTLASALADEPGRAALRRARAAAVARRDAAQVSEVDDLLAVAGAISENPALAGRIPMPEVSAGTLDRVRIAMGGRGERLRQSPDTRDIAAGMFARASDIDNVLDQVPGLRPARDTYRTLSGQIDAVEEGARGLTAPPATFRFDEATRAPAQVGYREAIETAIGRPTEGATGLLNRLATSVNQRRNLGEVFGPDAEAYQAGIGNLVDQLNNARFLASSSGSQTTPRIADQALVEAANIPTSATQGIMFVLSKLGRGATLTRAEREALVRLGITEPQLEALRQAAPISGRLIAPTAGALTNFRD